MDTLLYMRHPFIFESLRPCLKDLMSKFVNVKLPRQVMNEVTMRSALTVHCSGFSWQELHKFATIFNMSTPLEHMPQHYLDKIEDVVKLTDEESMQGAADGSIETSILHVHQ